MQLLGQPVCRTKLPRKVLISKRKMVRKNDPKLPEKCLSLVLLCRISHRHYSKIFHREFPHKIIFFCHDENLHPVLPFLGFSVLPRKNLKLTKDFCPLPNPLKPWKNQRKRTNDQGNSLLKINQGIPEKARKGMTGFSVKKRDFQCKGGRQFSESGVC